MIERLKGDSVLILLWIVLATLGGFMAYQLYSITVLGGAWLINSPWRPLYWNFGHVQWIARFMVIVIGMMWVFYVSLLERLLINWQAEKRLKERIGRLIGAQILIVVVTFVIAQLLVLGWQG